MSNSTRIATIAGIPIKVHISLWIILPILALFGPFSNMSAGFMWGLIFACTFFACIALHELGHSLVALQKGCSVRQILLTPIGGIAMMDNMPSAPRDEILVAAAGPAVSLLLSFFFGFASMFFLMGVPNAINSAPAVFLTSLAFSNFAVALFNLIPSFPMDGGRIFRAWMIPRVGKLEATRRAAKIGRILAIAFGVVGLFSGSVLLIVIAIFIYFAAGAEYRAVQFQEGFMRNIFSTGTRPSTPPRGSSPNHRAPRQTETREEGFTAAPPPYANTPNTAANQKKKDAARIKNVFDDLYSDWH